MFSQWLFFSKGDNMKFIIELEKLMSEVIKTIFNFDY